ncbi:MAG TPA: BON domain-containing protein [Longimicrobiaceae bacterium]|nr:BON domain-containing protein [Longimicrobiaceae bacterium]
MKHWKSTEASAAGVVLVLLLAASGCGLIGRSSPPPDRSEDPRIKGQVEARIAAEPSLEASQIRVEVDAGTVMLHGTTAGIGAMQCAIATAGLVEGVSTVVNYLVLQRGPRDVTCLAPRPTQ